MSLTALLFVALFGAGSLAAFVRHPIYGLMTYVAVFYVHPPGRWWGQPPVMQLRWSLIAAAVTVIAMLLRRPQRPTVEVFRHPVFWVYLIFVAWIAVQSNWALDQEAHAYLLELYLKFAVVLWMICRCIETETHLRLFFWSHVGGCFYLAWLAFSTYLGGRLDGVGGPGIDEANAAALQVTTGVFVASSLLLVGGWLTRGSLVLMLPLMVNALIATISRSGFLGAFIGGLTYLAWAPARYRKHVWVLAGLAGALFLLLSNQMYWDRISTIQYAGKEVEGVDTGGGRVQIIEAQIRMFTARPMGCGHWCTAVLSPSYIDPKYLTKGGERASHNTFMSMLVDHGVVGGVFYLAMLVWMYVALRRTRRALAASKGFLAASLTAVAASLIAITIGDLFVQYPRSEVRIWFIGILIVLNHMAVQSRSEALAPVGSDREQLSATST